MKHWIIVGACAALVLGTGTAWAGALDAGDAAYSAGQYPAAAADYAGAATTLRGAEQAKAFYKLGNAYHKEGQSAQALAAYQQAQGLDPSLGFASSPDKFRAALARVSGSASASPVANTRAGTQQVPAGRDTAYQALVSSNVYVDPRVPGVNAQAMEQAAVQGRDNPHTLVKIAVLDHLPPSYTSAGMYAGKLHQALSLGKNGLVVVAWRGRGAGVGVATDGISQSENAALAQEYGPKIAANPNAGTAQLANAVASQINNREYQGTSALWIVFFIVVAFVAWLVVSAARRKKAVLGQALRAIAPLRQYVLESIGYLDGYAAVLPKNNPDSDRTRALRQTASEKYDNAERILSTATAESDMQRAQSLLQSARGDVDTARKTQDMALGGTANIAGDDALRPQPLPESQAEVEAVPEGRRGASFFSSQPAPLSSLVPVTVTINGQSKQVLATPEEANELRQGRMPQVRTFDVGGQRVPWYAYNNYDPYNDYWRYQNNGWGGFGGGVMTGLVAAELMGDLFSPRYYGGGGYSPYAFSTDNGYYQGYQDAERHDAASGSSFGDWGNSNAPDNAGGASFMSDGPGYDTSDYGNSGGSSFMGGNDNS